MTKQIELDTPPDLPPVAQAVSLALGVLSVAKKRSWSDLGDDICDGVTLSQQQLALLSIHSLAVGAVRWSAQVSGSRHRLPLITAAVCPTCGRWYLIGRGAASKCRLTSSCTGHPIKVKVAKKRSVKVDAGT